MCVCGSPGCGIEAAGEAQSSVSEVDSAVVILRHCSALRGVTLMFVPKLFVVSPRTRKFGGF